MQHVNQNSNMENAKLIRVCNKLATGIWIINATIRVLLVRQIFDVPYIRPFIWNSVWRLGQLSLDLYGWKRISTIHSSRLFFRPAKAQPSRHKSYVSQIKPKYPNNECTTARQWMAENSLYSRLRMNTSKSRCLVNCRTNWATNRPTHNVQMAIPKTNSLWRNSDVQNVPDIWWLQSATAKTQPVENKSHELFVTPNNEIR